MKFPSKNRPILLLLEALKFLFGVERPTVDGRNPAPPGMYNNLQNKAIINWCRISSINSIFRGKSRWKFNLDLFKIILYICLLVLSIVNHHQSTIWDNIFGPFPKHRGQANPSQHSRDIAPQE